MVGVVLYFVLCVEGRAGPTSRQVQPEQRVETPMFA